MLEDRVVGRTVESRRKDVSAGTQGKGWYADGYREPMGRKS